MKGARRILCTIALCAVGFTFAAGPVRATVFNPVRLTFNTNDDYYPWIDGNKIVWQGFDNWDYEIYCYDTQTGETTEISHNLFGDFHPIVDGDYVLWTHVEGDDAYLLLHDLESGETVQLSQGDYTTIGRFEGDNGTLIDGGLVTWREQRQVFLYDASTGETIQITDNDEGNRFPTVSQGRVAWTSTDSGNTRKVYLYDVTTGETEEIYSSPDFLSEVKISGDHLAWRQYMGADPGPIWDIFVHDVSTGETRRITGTDKYNNLHAVAEQGVAWTAWGGTGSFDGVFFYDFATGETNLVVDGSEQTADRLYAKGSDLVWQGTHLLGVDVFHYDILTGEVTRVSRGIVTDEYPTADSGRVVWQAYDVTSGHYEIFLGIPSPGSECFIATAAFGSSLEPRVACLREFRDRVLMRSRPGRILVDAYYVYSPPVAALISEHPALRRIVRTALAPVVGLAEVILELSR